MFTNDSIQLRNYFFNHMKFKNSIDFQNLYIEILVLNVMKNLLVKTQ